MEGIGVDGIIGILDINNPDVEVIWKYPFNQGTDTNALAVLDGSGACSGRIVFESGWILGWIFDNPTVNHYKSTLGFGNNDLTFALNVADWLGANCCTSIDALIGDVLRACESGIANKGICTSLVQKLKNAQKALDAFVNEVEAQSGKHLTEETAAELIDSAKQLAY